MGESILNVVENEVKQRGQSIKNCISFANMIGCNNSVWTGIKKAFSHCMQLKCIGHSLDLRKLPSNIGFLLSEIPQWFCNSKL